MHKKTCLIYTVDEVIVEVKKCYAGILRDNSEEVLNGGFKEIIPPYPLEGMTALQLKDFANVWANIKADETSLPIFMVTFPNGLENAGQFICLTDAWYETDCKDGENLNN